MRDSEALSVRLSPHVGNVWRRMKALRSCSVFRSDNEKELRQSNQLRLPASLCDLCHHLRRLVISQNRVLRMKTISTSFP